MGFHRKGPAGGKPRPERAPRQWQARTRPNEAFDRGDSRESPGLRATKVHNSGRRVDLPPRGRTYFGRFKEKLLSTSEKNSRGAHLLMHPRRREGSQEVQEPEELIGGRTYLAVRAQLQFSKSSRGRKLWRGQRRKNEGKSLKKFKSQIKPTRPKLCGQEVQTASISEVGRAQHSTENSNSENFSPPGPLGRVSAAQRTNFSTNPSVNRCIRTPTSRQ